jgi:hypothetical protein
MQFTFSKSLRCSQTPLAAASASAVYADGRVCISILHNPGDDPNGYETAAERWSPVQSVRNGRGKEFHQSTAHCVSVCFLEVLRSSVFWLLLVWLSPCWLG